MRIEVLSNYLNILGVQEAAKYHVIYTLVIE